MTPSPPVFVRSRAAFVVILAACCLASVAWLTQKQETARAGSLVTVTWSGLLRQAEEGRLVSAEYDPEQHAITATPKEGRFAYRAVVPDDAQTLHLLVAKGVEVSVRHTPPSWINAPWLLALLPVLLLVGVIVYLSRRSAGMASGPPGQSMGKTRANRVDNTANPVRLKDVAGCDEARAEVAEIVDFLRRPEDYARVGARGPQGILMSGPPGTGKTLLAKAIAGEAGVPFFSTSGSDFVEMFVGVGAARARDMFQQAKLHAPSIVFIDEIDAIGRARGGGSSMGSHEERDQTLNALLVEMDGFVANQGVVVIAATNRPDVLDPALRRPGRFDREVVIGLPDREGRAQILALHAARVPVDPAVQWASLARGTPGFSGADLANLINEAAMAAARTQSTCVTQAHLEAARDKVTMGVARKGGLKDAGQRRVVAYHESGHAVVAHFEAHADPVHKVTIVPHGSALGLTMQLPEEDVINHDRPRLMATLKVLMGGRAAEEVALATATVGASNDFERASLLARRMVARWGMSPLGPVAIEGEQGLHASAWSEHWKNRVDDAVAAILTEAHAAAVTLLTEKRVLLDRVALALLEQETLGAEDFGRLVAEPALALSVQANLPLPA